MAFLKLAYLCHAGATEIAGFAISDEHDLLHVRQFETVLQGATAAHVELADGAVADFFDECIDRGLSPQHFARIWCHTHPGDSPDPSRTDEQTFDRVFGSCDWAVMFILSRTGRTYCRMCLNVGPGASMQLPVRVDWASLPAELAAAADLAQLYPLWRSEYERNVHALMPPPWSLLPSRVAAAGNELAEAEAGGFEGDPFPSYFELFAEMEEP